MSHRLLRCAACSRRIRENHPHIGVLDFLSGDEVSYHAHAACQERASENLHRMIERGCLYVLNHYHGEGA
jgi:hypothetical protein